MVKKVGQDKTKAKKVICRNCGAKLEYYPKEVKSKTASYMGESEVVCWVDCPECKAEVSVR